VFKLLTTISLLAVLTLSVASCGGQSASLDLAPGAQNGINDSANDTQGGSGLPSLPRESSGEPGVDAEDTIVVPGAAAIQTQNALADGTQLILTSTEADLAFALYKVEGLANKKVSGFSIELIPGGFESQYSVGVSNFSEGVWDFLTTSSLPEFEYSFSEDMERRTSELGNFYFLVVTSGGSSATVIQTTVFSHLRMEGEVDEPGCGGDIWVSQGLPASIVVEWSEIPGASAYEIYRKTETEEDNSGEGDRETSSEGSDWVLIATETGLRYEDFDVVLSQEYEYRVRGINEAGEGGHSGSASGYAGDPPAGWDGDDSGSGDDHGDDGMGDDGTGDDHGDDGMGDDGTGDDHGDDGVGDDGAGDDNGGDDGVGDDGAGDDNGGDDGVGDDGAGDDPGGDDGVGDDGAGDDRGGDDGVGDDGAGDDGVGDDGAGDDGAGDDGAGDDGAGDDGAGDDGAGDDGAGDDNGAGDEPGDDGVLP